MPAQIPHVCRCGHAQCKNSTSAYSQRIAEKLDVFDEGHGDKNATATSSPLTVFLDGAHIRCRPEYQKRHLDVVVGKKKNANMSRSLGLVQQAANSPAKQLRHDLIAQCWNGQSKVTVISDGEPRHMRDLEKYA